MAAFVSPTGNIRCRIDAGGAECRIGEKDWEAPPRPSDCDLEWGNGVSVAADEQPADFLCTGDPPDPTAPVLPYGQSLQADDVQCTSASAGVTCQDVRSRRGFTLSRASYRFF